MSKKVDQVTITELYELERPHPFRVRSGVRYEVRFVDGDMEEGWVGREDVKIIQDRTQGYVIVLGFNEFPLAVGAKVSRLSRSRTNSDSY